MMKKKNAIHPALFSFDNTPSTASYIKEGLVSFTLDQQPYLMGYLSITQLVLNNRLHLEPSDVNTGIGIVDNSNIDAIIPLIQRGFR